MSRPNLIGPKGSKSMRTRSPAVIASIANPRSRLAILMVAWAILGMAPFMLFAAEANSQTARLISDSGIGVLTPSQSEPDGVIVEMPRQGAHELAP